MKPTGLLSLTILTVLLAAPSAAPAATVSGEVILCTERGECGPGMQGGSFSTYRFATEAGERSTATVGRTGNVLRFHDDTARIRAGAQCRQVDDNTAECDLAASPPFLSVSLIGGAADDVLAVTTPERLNAYLEGGGGADELRGGGEFEILSGGAGADRISGGDGADTLVGGPDPDRLEGGAGDDGIYGDGGPDADRVTRGTGIYGSNPPALGASLPLGGDAIDGGEGSDRVGYEDHSAAVRVDLALAGNGQGAAGEGDSLVNLESVTGGSGDDALSGDGAANVLAGGDGDDRLRGRGGRDELSGGPGEDRFDGGAGNDALEPVDGDADDLRCGAGADSVGEDVGTGQFEEDGLEVFYSAGPEAADGVHQDCEMAYLDTDDRVNVILWAKLRTIRLLRGRTLLLPNPCRYRVNGDRARGRCRATVTVRSREGSRRKRTQRIRGTRAATVSVRLSGGIARAARRGRVAISFKLSRRYEFNDLTWTPRFTAVLD